MFLFSGWEPRGFVPRFFWMGGNLPAWINSMARWALWLSMGPTPSSESWKFKTHPPGSWNVRTIHGYRKCSMFFCLGKYIYLRFGWKWLIHVSLTTYSIDGCGIPTTMVWKRWLLWNHGHFRYLEVKFLERNSLIIRGVDNELREVVDSFVDIGFVLNGLKTHILKDCGMNNHSNNNDWTGEVWHD